MPFQGSPPSAEESSRYGKAESLSKAYKASKFEVRLEVFQKIQNGRRVEYVQKGIDEIMLAVSFGQNELEQTD